MSAQISSPVFDLVAYFLLLFSCRGSLFWMLISYQLCSFQIISPINFFFKSHKWNRNSQKTCSRTEERHDASDWNKPPGTPNKQRMFNITKNNTCMCMLWYILINDTVG